MKRLMSVFAIVSAIGLVVTACAAPTPEVVEKEVVVEKPVVETVVVEKEVVVEKVVTPTPLPEEFEIVIVKPDEPMDFERGDGSYEQENGQEKLVERDGTTGALRPVLAESWEQIDPNTWRFHLRKGVKFTNGVPFNAEIAKWNLEDLSDPENNWSVLQQLGQKLSVTAVDEYTIDVWTEDPDPILPRRLTFAMLGEPSAIEAEGELERFVGTGPYMLEEWVHGVKIVLVANPDYWGGEPEIKKVTYVFRTDSSVRAAMVAAGEADVAKLLAPQDTGPIRTVAVNVSETPFMYADPNPPLDDIRVRRAICMAMDRDALAQKIFSGYATPASQLVAPDVLGYNADIPVFPYDPEAAQALIEEARADGVPVDTEITIYGRKGIYPNATEAMEALHQWLTDIGLNVKLQMLETAAWREVNLGIPVPPDRVGLIQSSHGNEMGDASQTLQAYYGPYGPADWYTFDDKHGGARRPIIAPKIVELIDQARTLTEEEGRAEALAAVFAYDHDNILWACPMVYIQDLYGASDRIDWTPRFDRRVLVKEIKLKR